MGLLRFYFLSLSLPLSPSLSLSLSIILPVFLYFSPTLSPSSLFPVCSPASLRFFPRQKNPLLFYLARPVFVSLCLSRRGLLYALSAVRAQSIVFARASFEPDSLARASRRKRNREGRLRIRSNGEERTMEKKGDTIKGVKVDTIERETATLHA